MTRGLEESEGARSGEDSHEEHGEQRGEVVEEGPGGTDQGVLEQHVRLTRSERNLEWGVWREEPEGGTEQFYNAWIVTGPLVNIFNLDVFVLYYNVHDLKFKRSYKYRLWSSLPDLRSD